MTRKRSSRSHEGIEFRIEVFEAEFKQLIVEILECGLRGAPGRGWDSPRAKSSRHVRRRIDRRDWPQYNRWQSDEVRLACLFLKDLVESATIHDWERRKGRPRLPRRELILCLLVRAYFHLSFRRTIGLLRL